MAYRIEIASTAEADIALAFERISEESPSYAERWLLLLFEAIFSLSEMPNRCAVIPEAGKIGKEIRHLLYGKRTSVYRIIFDIQEGDNFQVRILRVWHGSRDRLQIEDIKRNGE